MIFFWFWFHKYIRSSVSKVIVQLIVYSDQKLKKPKIMRGKNQKTKYINIAAEYNTIWCCPFFFVCFVNLRLQNVFCKIRFTSHNQLIIAIGRGLISKWWWGCAKNPLLWELKFSFCKKATKFETIFHVYLATAKLRGRWFQTFEAFSECPNFTVNIGWLS